MNNKYYCAKPTKEQLEWQDAELGVIIHYTLASYYPDVDHLSADAVKQMRIDNINPPKLDPEQWIIAAKSMGATYAVLCTVHGSGLALWPTKVNDFSVAQMAWKDGKGDIVREFVDACKKHGIRPGLYYPVANNGYYDINAWKMRDQHHTEKYQSYLRACEAQIEELWQNYGELFEIWFDGGTLPKEDGGIDMYSYIQKYQPHALCFQGPKENPNNVRWVGNELGAASENCWATSNVGEASFSGLIEDEPAGRGNPNGKYYIPAEADRPNRDAKTSYAGGWCWRAGEEHSVIPPEELLQHYITSVGRNSNFLLGMAITTDGDFQDTEQFAELGRLIKEHFGTPVAILEAPEMSKTYTLDIPEGKEIRYVVIREDITEGQRIRSYTVKVDGEEIISQHCIGHKRIVPLGGFRAAKKVELIVSEDVGDHAVRDLAVY
ncbi:MAG: alpha-L-fucosidase [Clostridia bacterium]|nr:alpha-L-fucosidase [Clostridia bacterium]